jgi:predicted ATPase
VQGLLASRIDRLSLEHKELVQTLAVMGRESPLALIRQVATRPESELEPMLAALQAGEFIYEAPAAVGINYTFKHVLTQEVAYNSLLTERRKHLHERVGAALESLYALQLDDHLSELAHHYSNSENVDKAIEYLGRAGQQALHRSAHADAISNLGAGLILVQKLPGSPERIRMELVLQLAIGPALMVVKGFAAPEAERAYSRACELCERVGDVQALFPALLGLWLTYLTRGRLRKTREVAEQLMKVAQRADDPVPLIYAENRFRRSEARVASMALAVTLYWMGEYLPVRERLESAIRLYNLERHGPVNFGYYSTADARVSCLSYGAWNLWQLGHADQALKKGDQAIALAQELSHPHSLAVAYFFPAFCVSFGEKHVQLKRLQRA